jgi:hypothetical protein
MNVVIGIVSVVTSTGFKLFTCEPWEASLYLCFGDARDNVHKLTDRIPTILKELV